MQISIIICLNHKHKLFSENISILDFIDHQDMVINEVLCGCLHVALCDPVIKPCWIEIFQPVEENRRSAKLKLLVLLSKDPVAGLQQSIDKL